MKLQGIRELYYTYSGKTSDLIRQTGLGGIAVIWIFKVEAGGSPKVPHELLFPLLLIVGGLASDLLQYIVATATYGIYQRKKELAGAGEEDDFKLPRQFNWASICFFVLKCTLITIAYAFLLHYVFKRIV